MSAPDYVERARQCGTRVTERFLDRAYARAGKRRRIDGLPGAFRSNFDNRNVPASKPLPWSRKTPRRSGS